MTKIYKFSGIPKAYWDLCLEDFYGSLSREEFRERFPELKNIDRQYEKGRNIYNLINNYVANLKNNLKMGRGMFFYGTVGTGKTMLMMIILKRIINLTDQRVKVISAADLVDNFAEGWKDAESKKEFERIRDIDVLGIEELNQEIKTKISNPVIQGLLNHRTSHYKPTFITTNMTPKTFKMLYPKSVVSRIKGSFFLVNCSSPIDYRNVLQKEINGGE